LLEEFGVALQTFLGLILASVGYNADIGIKSSQCVYCNLNISVNYLNASYLNISYVVSLVNVV